MCYWIKLQVILCLIYHCFCFLPFNVINLRKVTITVISTHPTPKTTCPNSYTWMLSLPLNQLQEERSGESVLERRKSIFLGVRTTDVFLFPSCRHGAEPLHPRASPSASVATPTSPRTLRAKPHKAHPGTLVHQHLTFVSGGKTKLVLLKEMFHPSQENFQ